MYSFDIPPALQFRLKAYMDVAPDINRKTCGAHMDNLGPADVVSGLGLTKPHCHSCQPKHSKVKSTQARTPTSAQQFSASAVTLPSTQEKTKCKFLKMTKPVKRWTVPCAVFLEGFRW